MVRTIELGFGHARTGIRTQDTVKKVLTRSPIHPNGIKVRLTDGKVGRVQEILPKKKEWPESFGNSPTKSKNNLVSNH